MTGSTDPSFNSGFDAHLSAMFDEARAPLETRYARDEFTQALIARLERPERARFWALAAAGGAGALLAGSQLPRAGAWLGETLPQVSMAGAGVEPHLLVGAIAAAFALAFAAVMPRRGAL